MAEGQVRARQSAAPFRIDADFPMSIRAGFRMSFQPAQTTPAVALLSVHPSRRGLLRKADRILISRDVRMDEQIDAFGNRCTRFILPEGPCSISCDFIIADSGLPDDHAPDALQSPIEVLPADILIYLLGSRYCETDLLSDFAWSHFGHVEPGWQRAQAVIDFTHRHIEFDYAAADDRLTALGAFRDRRGVCRDFTHLAIALCRCLNMPARYCSGYLGDIGVPPEELTDFSGWLEVYLGGRWHTFDARHNRRRIGRIPIAYGRDAADTALITTFGRAPLTEFKVHTLELRSSANPPGSADLSAPLANAGVSALTE